MKINWKKIISVLTLTVPLPLYLFISATVFGTVPDVTLNAKMEDISVVEEDGNYYLTASAETEFKGGYVIFKDGLITTVIEYDDVVKTKDGLTVFTKDKDGLIGLQQMNLIEKELSYKLPMAFIVSAFGVLIVALVIMGKMGIAKQYPRIATLVALWVMALTFVIIDTIVRNLTGVFLVAALSWSVYCIEYMAFNGKMAGDEAKKKTDSLESTLRAMLKWQTSWKMCIRNQYG